MKTRIESLLFFCSSTCRYYFNPPFPVASFYLSLKAFIFVFLNGVTTRDWQVVVGNHRRYLTKTDGPTWSGKESSRQGIKWKEMKISSEDETSWNALLRFRQGVVVVSLHVYFVLRLGDSFKLTQPPAEKKRDEPRTLSLVVIAVYLNFFCLPGYFTRLFHVFCLLIVSVDMMRVKTRGTTSWQSRRIK